MPPLAWSGPPLSAVYRIIGYNKFVGYYSSLLFTYVPKIPFLMVWSYFFNKTYVVSIQQNGLKGTISTHYFFFVWKVVQIIFSFPLGSLNPLWYLWKWSSAHVYATGSKQCCKLHFCLWSLNKTETPIFYLYCVLWFQGQSFRLLFYFTAAGVSAVWQSYNGSLYFTIVQIIFSFLLG